MSDHAPLYALAIAATVAAFAVVVVVILWNAI